MYVCMYVCMHYVYSRYVYYNITIQVHTYVCLYMCCIRVHSYAYILCVCIHTYIGLFTIGEGAQINSPSPASLSPDRSNGDLPGSSSATSTLCPSTSGNT